jgi:hypothetical protein
MKFGSDRTERGFPLEAVRRFKNQEAGNEKQAARSRKWAGCHILPVGGCRGAAFPARSAVPSHSSHRNYITNIIILTQITVTTT